MPRKRTGRTTNDAPRRRTNGGLRSMTRAPRPRSTSVPPYVRDPRWATATRRRTDVFVIDVTDRYAATASSPDDDPLLLTA